MDKNIKMMRIQMDNQKTTLLILAGMTLVGAVSLMAIAPGLTSPNTITTKISDTSKTNIVTNTTKKATTTKATTKKTTASSKKKRPVYIVSDNINGKTADSNRMKKICQGLKKKGITCHVSSIGPNSHNTIMQNKKVPSNALVVEIFGGKCAGTIWDLGTKYYKKIKGSRKVHLVYLPSKYKLNTSWLPKAHDDNFSKIKGIVRPDLFLKKAGYSYTESNNTTKIVNDIYKQATK